MVVCISSSQAPHHLVEVAYTGKCNKCNCNCSGKARKMRLLLLPSQLPLAYISLSISNKSKQNKSSLRMWRIKIHRTSEMNFNHRVRFADVIIWGGLLKLQQNRLPLSTIFHITKATIWRAEERRAVRSDLLSENENRYNVRRNVHHT